MKLSAIILFILVIINVNAQIARIAKVSSRYIDDVVEVVWKNSGKLKKVSRLALRKQIVKIAAKHGEDGLKFIKTGGLGLAKASAKYGDDVFKFVKKVPNATKVLSQNADELIPLTRKYGTGILKIESKVPGLSTKAIKEFGGKNIKYLSKIPADDSVKLVGYAGKATSPSAKKLLISSYKKGGSEFLNSLNYKHIIAGGLSVAMITSAYKISNGLEEGMIEVSKNSPSGFIDIANSTITKILSPYILLGIGISVIILIWFLKKSKISEKAKIKIN